MQIAMMQIGQDLMDILFCGHRQADMALTGQTRLADLERSAAKAAMPGLLVGYRSMIQVDGRLTGMHRDSDYGGPGVLTCNCHDACTVL